jgi:hypothetical protein
VVAKERLREVAKTAEPVLTDDPRYLDREGKQRLRVMIHLEKIKGAWGSVLYTLRDSNRITRDQADAGDRYWTLTQDYRRLMETDPQTELDIRRVDRAKKRYAEVLDIMGMVRKYVDEVVFENVWPVGERGHLAVVQGLELLRIFFDTGTKRKRKKA